MQIKVPSSDHINIAGANILYMIYRQLQFKRYRLYNFQTIKHIFLHIS